MKKYSEENNPSRNREKEFYRHARLFLLQSQNAQQIKL